MWEFIYSSILNVNEIWDFLVDLEHQNLDKQSQLPYFFSLQKFSKTSRPLPSISYFPQFTLYSSSPTSYL